MIKVFMSDVMTTVMLLQQFDINKLFATLC